MTLGSWVKNYLYIPMGGNRNGELCKMRNLLVAMLLIGLWHGAGWTFVLWGGLHGIFLMINHQWRRLGIQLPIVLDWGITFLCVVICWVFFRAESFAAGWSVVVAMFSVGNGLSAWTLPVGKLKVAVVLAFLTVILAMMPNPQALLQRFRPNGRWLLLILILLLLAMVNLNQYSEFLYFQF